MASPAAGESCEAIVARLNSALATALSELLPANAKTTSNLVSQRNPQLDSGATFYPRPDRDGQRGFEAPIRIRVDQRAGVFDVSLSRYRAIPPTDDCPDNTRLAEMASKGMAQHRCDRSTVNGAVVVVHDSSEPYGSGEYADLRLHNLNVTAYRADGMRVSTSLSPVIERLPDGSTARQALTENFLTLAQLQALALNASFVFA